MDKNYYWRSSPRTILETVMRALLRRNRGVFTPGMLWAVVASPEVLFDLLSVEADEADDDPALQAKCKQLLAMREHNPEHWFQHVGASIDALRIFEEGSFLHLAGEDL